MILCLFLPFDTRFLFLFQLYFVTEFFSKKGVATMTVKEFFDFITDITIVEENMEQYLDKISEKLYSPSPLTDEQIIDEEVFKNAYIPRTLNEVSYFSPAE